MRDLMLALRLVKGAGRAGAIRLLLMAAGLAVGVSAVLVVATIPGVLSARDTVLEARDPVPAVGDQRADLQTFPVRGSWHGSPVLRTMIAGADASSPLPPGVTRLPRAGEVVLSPAAARLRRDPGFGNLVPGTDAGRVGPAGLTGPDEVVAYIGVGNDQVPDGRGTIGWGVASGSGTEGTGQFRLVALETALLVLPATALLVVVCGRLAAATRRRRYAALNLVGAGPRTVARVAALEASVAGVTGAGLGITVYRLAEPVLARSGALGISWFSGRAAIGLLPLTATILAALGAARVFGALAARRSGRSGLIERRSPEDADPHWWRILPVVAGLGFLSPFVLRERPTSDGNAELFLVLGAFLTVAGGFLATGLITHRFAGALARVRGVGPRLGAARLRIESARATRLVAGLGLLVLTATLSVGILASAERTASSADRPVRVHVYGDEVPEPVRDQIAQLGGGMARWATVTSQIVNDQSAPSESLRWRLAHEGAELLVAGCERASSLLGAPLPNCLDAHWYRVSARYSVLPLEAGQKVRFAHDQGSSEITVPVETVQAGSGASAQANFASLLYTGDRPPGGWYQQSTFFFQLGAGIDELDRFSSGLAAIAPEATANGSLDLEALDAYRAHRAAILLGVRVAYLLGIIAVLVALVDRALERRPQVAALVVVGSSRSTIRIAQAVYALVPMAVGCGLALGAGTLISNAYAALDSERAHWTWAAFRTGLPLTGVALILALSSGLIVIGFRPRPEELRRA